MGGRNRKQKPETAIQQEIRGVLDGFEKATGLQVCTRALTDRWRDIDAGRAAGCRTIFINRHYSEKQPDSPDALVETTAQAAAWILAQDKNASSVTAATHLQPTSAPATEMEPDTP